MKKTRLKSLRSTHGRQGRAKQVEEESSPPSRTLVVDIGRTGIKATLLNDLSRPLGERVRRDTPASGMPGEVMDVVIALSKEYEPFDRVAVGFPGVIIDGIVKQAPNFAPEWQGFNIAEMLQASLKKPVRVANDADVQGFGAISGIGVEM